MRRSPLLRRVGLARKTGLARVGKRQRALAKDWKLCKGIVWAREGGYCQWCQGFACCHPIAGHVPECSGILDYHHVIPRSKAKHLVCDPDNVVLIHRSFHTYIHDNPRWARENGWLK